MSRTRYESAAEIEARIDYFMEKRDRNLNLAHWLTCGSRWLNEHAENAGSTATASGMRASAREAESESAKLRSAAAHEDTVTLPKLKARLAEMNTAPLLRVGETSVTRK